MKVLKFLLLPFAVLYGIPIWIRNYLYDKGIFKSTKFDIPTIVIGNLCAGGTGKSPHTIMIAQQLSKNYKVAVLSRGYGRKSIGFREVTAQDTSDLSGDEPLMIKQSLEDSVRVFVDVKRVRGIIEIAKVFPEVEVVMLDDAFQHRALKGGFNILLTRAQQPFYKDYLLPIGRLREFRKGFKRADVLIFTKVPKNSSENFTEIILKKYGKDATPALFTSQIKYGDIDSLDTQKETLNPNTNQLILVTGIAFGGQLKNELEKNYKVEWKSFKDHHEFRTQDLNEIHKIFDNLADSNKGIVTTEKDAVKIKPLLLKHDEKRLKNWFVQKIEPQINNEEKLLDLIENYVRENQ